VGRVSAGTGLAQLYLVLESRKGNHAGGFRKDRKLERQARYVSLEVEGRDDSVELGFGCAEGVPSRQQTSEYSMHYNQN
jgi:hypothetical protein